MLERLPVAIALIDRSGAIVGKAGQAADIFRDVIPSFDRRQLSRWRTTDLQGNSLPPSRWPSPRALMGEVDYRGSIARYQNGEERLFKIIAVPTFAPASEIAAVSFLHRIDAPCRSADGSHGDLEHRLIETLAHAIATQHVPKRGAREDPARLRSPSSSGD